MAVKHNELAVCFVSEKYHQQLCYVNYLPLRKACHWPALGVGLVLPQELALHFRCR